MREQRLRTKSHVSKEDQVQEMFRSAVAQFGTIDILVNNTGLQGWGVLGSEALAGIALLDYCS